MSQRSDYAALLRTAERAGCTVAKGRHIKVTTPGGAVISCSHSPSDVNAVHQLRRDLRKAGVSV